MKLFGRLLILLFPLTTWAASVPEVELALRNTETVERFAELKRLSEGTEIEGNFQKFPENWIVRPVVEFPLSVFYIGAPDVNKAAYIPNFNIGLGANVSWKTYGGTFTFALPLPSDEIRRRGQTQQTAFVFNSYWHGNAMDLYYQNYHGLYLSRPLDEFDFNKADVYPQLPDAEILSYGVNWYHNLDPENYSLSAAFDQKEFQIKDGGAWIINPFFNHLRVSLGKTFISGTNPDLPQTLPGITLGSFETFGAAVGYGYMWVHHRYFADAQGAIGPALQYENFQNISQRQLTHFSFAAKINVNLSAGYNGRLWLMGIKLLLDSLSSQTSTTQMASSLVDAQVFIGRRF